MTTITIPASDWIGPDEGVDVPCALTEYGTDSYIVSTHGLMLCSVPSSAVDASMRHIRAMRDGDRYRVSLD